MPNLLTYGTLKQGQCRGSFLANHKFLGRFRTAPNFKLYETDYMGRNNYPCLVEVDSGGYPVYGELYEVNDKQTWNILDEIEGVKHGLYKQSEVKVENANGEVLDAVVYAYLRPLEYLKEVGYCWPVSERRFWDIEGKLVLRHDDGLQLVCTQDRSAISPVLPDMNELSQWCAENTLIFSGASIPADGWKVLLMPFLEKIEQFRDGVFVCE